MSCGQPGRWGCPDVDRFQGGSREERMMARRRDRTRRGWVTGWIEDGKRKTDTERPGDAHIDTLARMALQARDCKVVTTEHSAGAIGNRLQLPSSIYANHLSLSLSRSLSLVSLSSPSQLLSRSSVRSSPNRRTCMRPDTTACRTLVHRARPCLPRGHKIPDSPIASPINTC